jgi:predicted adenine nucleotide alpha hydrolase (AANH) superfamily ATPase
MVVHLCCSVDAGYFLKRLQEDFPEEKLIGYFYDPNIHPYSEFKLRSLDTERICKNLGVEYVEGEYDYESWLKAVKGKESEPEKGVRCSVCFDHSLEATAKYAQKIGDNKITTSLLMSPMKSQEQLSSVGKVIKRKYGIDFYAPDYRKKGGTQAQQQFAKDTQMYRQDYCGCLYGIWQQKRKQEIIDELISPLPFQILPSSIEEKLEFYKNRIKLEEKGIKYKIVKENFLNYRLLRGNVKCKIGSGEWKNEDNYILFYSYLQRPARGKIELIKDGIGYFNRMQVIFVDIKKFNEVLNKTYQNVKEIYKNPPTVKEELDFREKITNVAFSLSPIIVVDEIYEKYEVDIDAKIYPDNKEILIKF